MIRNVILIGCLLLHTAFCLADEAEEKKKLEQLTRKIQTVQSDIQHTNREIRALETDLEKAERELAKTRKAIDTTHKAINEQERELSRLKSEQASLVLLRDKQRAAIATQINLGYRIGREPTLKLLLNQEDPELLSRTLRYHDYFLKARANKLANYLSTIQQLIELEQQQQQSLQRLVAAQNELESQMQLVLDQNKVRQNSLKALNQSVASDKSLLSKLEVERSRLESVLKQLEEALANIKVPASYSSFTSRKGNLAWPVSGRLEKSYGQPRNAKMKWEGWLLQADEGSVVRAVHHGRVVFADYLRGHGLLVVIDHGEGYMSLYAHNQILLTELGDWISSGTPIARVGVSGGQQQAGLYFEIRHQGKPSNPAGWLKRGG